MLNVRDLVVEIGGKTIVDGTTFQVRAGDKVGLVGRNGAGKTTLFRVLAAITPPNAEPSNDQAALATSHRILVKTPLIPRLSRSPTCYRAEASMSL